MITYYRIYIQKKFKNIFKNLPKRLPKSFKKGGVEVGKSNFLALVAFPLWPPVFPLWPPPSFPLWPGPKRLTKSSKMGWVELSRWILRRMERP